MQCPRHALGGGGGDDDDDAHVLCALTRFEAGGNFVRPIRVEMDGRFL